MIRITLAAFAALATLASPGAAIGAETIRTEIIRATPPRPVLKPEAVVTGDIVRIGDLIDNAGIVASVPIFRAPDLGYTGAISVDSVLEAVRGHALIGVDTAGIRDIVVTRASRTIPIKDIEDVVARALSARFDIGPAKDIVVTFAREPRAMYVEPSVQGTPRITQIDFDIRSGRFDAMLDFPAGSGKRTAMRLLGRATATVEVATVTRTIERGGVIRDSDLLMERRPRAEAGRETITDREQAIGLAARTNLQPGRPLRVAELVKPDLVQRGDLVTLVYEVPGIVLTLRGKAMEGGALGNTISVINEQSKRTVQGTIAGPGRVLIYSSSPKLAANSVARPGGTSDTR
jgi:flagellar basal body P-ring formation protein FlgA